MKGIQTILLSTTYRRLKCAIYLEPEEKLVDSSSHFNRGFINIGQFDSLKVAVDNFEESFRLTWAGDV